LRGVEEVATTAGDVRRHVFPAAGTSGCLEATIFVIGAEDLCMSRCGGEKAADQVCKGGDAVHEHPEAWEGCLCHDDTGRLLV